MDVTLALHGIAAAQAGQLGFGLGTGQNHRQDQGALAFQVRDKTRHLPSAAKIMRQQRRTAFQKPRQAAADTAQRRSRFGNIRRDRPDQRVQARTLADDLRRAVANGIDPLLTDLRDQAPRVVQSGLQGRDDLVALIGQRPQPARQLT